MKSLADSKVRSALQRRVQALTPDARRRWGKMSSHQMLCHLNDSFLSVTGRRKVSRRGGILERTVIKFIALHAPTHWPKGVPTLPEIDQMSGGTPPLEWERDRAELARFIEWFASPAVLKTDHPIFGALSESQWMRWGYLHVDHHLRQFGL